MVVGIFLAEFLTQDLGHYRAYEDQAIALTMTRLLQAVAGDSTIVSVDEPAIDNILGQQVLRKLGGPPYAWPTKGWVRLDERSGLSRGRSPWCDGVKTVR